jgi:hypothetical protein
MRLAKEADGRVLADAGEEPVLVDADAHLPAEQPAYAAEHLSA